MIDCTKTIRRAPDMIEADSAGETIVVNLKNGRFFGLGGAGGFVWSRLEKPATAIQILEQLTVAFEVEPAVAQADLAAFLQSLAVEGLVTNVDEPSATGEQPPLKPAVRRPYEPAHLEVGTLRQAAHGFNASFDGGGISGTYASS